MATTKESNKSGKQDVFISLNSAINLSNTANIIEYLRNGGISPSVNENPSKIVVPHKGVISSLVVKLEGNNGSEDASPGENVSRIFTVRKNGQDTNLKVIISNNQIQGESNIEIPVNKYDLISLSHTVTANTSKKAIGIASVSLSQK